MGRTSQQRKKLMVATDKEVTSLPLRSLWKARSRDSMLASTIRIRQNRQKIRNRRNNSSNKSITRSLKVGLLQYLDFLQ